MTPLCEKRWSGSFQGCESRGLSTQTGEVRGGFLKEVASELWLRCHWTVPDPQSGKDRP